MNYQAYRSCCLVLAALAIAWTPPRAQGAENIVSAEHLAILLAPTKGLRPVSEDRPSVNLSSVTFNFGSFLLTDNARRQLTELGKALSMPAFKNTRFVIGGHTDGRGSESFNKMLSEQRAEAVVAYLASRFKFGARQLVPVGWGMSRLWPELSSEDSRQRRAEVVNDGPMR